jgi:hypothetical protein
VISDDRVNFVAPGNYEENSQLDIIVKGILGRIGHSVNKPLGEAAQAEILVWLFSPDPPEPSMLDYDLTPR